MPALTQAAAADLFREKPDRFLDVDAGEAAYRRVGSGPDVLFIPGWPVTGATFRKLLPHLADHVTCHVFDFPGTGASRFTENTPMSIQQHIETVRRIVDRLELDDVAVVGHDSGGLIARHALAGDPRVRAMGLIDTEQPQGLSRRFKMFIWARKAPGLAPALGWVAGSERVRRNRWVFGDAFVDPTHIDGEFDEFFLRPLVDSPEHRTAAAELLASFDMQHVHDLADLHRRIEVPVQLVWGAHDRFFPVAWAREMVDTFPDARLAVVDDAGLFSHEERPAEVARALLPVVAGTP